jgi:hypothetical protein
MATSGFDIDDLHTFAKRPLAFRCRPAGRKGATERFVVHVVHTLHAPATPVEMSKLKRHLGECSPAFAAFYAKHNGFVLYRDTLSDAAGVEALPIAAWAKATQRVHDLARDVIDDEEDDTTGLLSCVAFATAPGSGNFFVVQTEGPGAGAIFYTNHGTCSKAEFAGDFGGFLRRITREPVTLLAKDLGCFARYSDGESSIQWIPDEIVTIGGRVGKP